MERLDKIIANRGIASRREVKELVRQGRILRMVYLNQDLTKAGKYLFPRLMQKFLVFTDRNGKTSLETMLKRWYTQLEKEYRNHIEG